MTFIFDQWELDSELYELRKDGRPCKVEPQVFDMVHYLVRNSERVVSKEEVVQEIWGGRIVSEATISTCLKAARQAIGDDGRSQRLIRTMRGRGFRFVGDVEVSNKNRATVESDQQQTSPNFKQEPVSAPPNTGVGAAASRQSRFVKPVLAVLPFDNLSADADDYFADGLTEDIITNLAKFRELLVIARTSTFKFKGRQVDLAEIGELLNAGYIVEGSVRRAATRVRITVQLIDATTGIHIWAESYDRGMEDIFAVQDEVTRTIAAALGVTLQDVALQRAMRKSSAELDAYDLVLRARRYTSLLSAEMHSEARDLLENAVSLDPTNADTAALLANVYLAEHRFNTNPLPDSIGRALKLAETAVRLDQHNAYARCWLAIVHFFRGETEMFRTEAQRALDLNPSDPETLADIGHYLAFMGEFERGIELSKRAQKLNPLHPGWYYFSFARYHFNCCEYEETLSYVERIGMPHFYWTHLLSAAALGQLERAEANDSLKQIYQVKPNFEARAELQKWATAPDDLEHLLEGLRKAGLKKS